jgi:sugar lactone lactonase YvrE
LDGSLPEGFTIGRGTTAYNGSIDGAIYKVDLRTGQGETLVEPEPVFDPSVDCYKLGMRVDPRTNYLFVAGCDHGNAYVFDADNGALIAIYDMPLPADTGDDTWQIVNDLAITKDAVYFTDSHQPLLYRLPLSRNGGLPVSNAVTAIKLVGDFVNIAEEDFCCGANGIVASADGRTLVVGHSNFTQLFRVDPTSGQADEIAVVGPLTGFLDGLVLHNDRTLYVLTPGETGPEGDRVQVVKLAKDLLTGEFLGTISDPENTDGIASGALFGNSLYVNNGHYFSEGPEVWITRLNRHAVE